MNSPLVSIVIPTYNRPHLLNRAVESALAQTVKEIEVIVIDDGSSPPVDLPEYPSLRVERQQTNRGIAITRNHGARTAKGRWITYLDDDDELMPHAIATYLQAIENPGLPAPVAVLAGLEVVTREGHVAETRLPPTLARGKYFSLEEIDPKHSFLSKQTLFIEREVLLGIGGYDETLSSREHTELFLRLNPVCSILGLSTVTYRQYRHSGPRLSHARDRRQVDFQRVVEKHRAVFQAHPKMFADFVYKHALISNRLGQRRAAFASSLRALRIHPFYTLTQIKRTLLQQWQTSPNSFLSRFSKR